MFMCWLCGIARIVENVFFSETEKECTVIEKTSRKEKLSNAWNEE